MKRSEDVCSGWHWREVEGSKVEMEWTRNVKT